jgi:hypothetical protein
MDRACPDTGVGIYQIQSLRELDAIAAISCWGWDERLRDMARSPDPTIQATLDSQRNWQGDRVAYLPRLSNPQTTEDLECLWQLQATAQLALVPIHKGLAWTAIALEWVQSPDSQIGRQPFQLWTQPHPGSTSVGRTQPIAICLGAIARHGRLFDLYHAPTARLLLPPELVAANQ